MILWIFNKFYTFYILYIYLNNLNIYLLYKIYIILKIKYILCNIKLLNLYSILRIKEELVIFFVNIHSKISELKTQNRVRLLLK